MTKRRAQATKEKQMSKIRKKRDTTIKKKRGTKATVLGKYVEKGLEICRTGQRQKYIKIRGVV